MLRKYEELSEELKQEAKRWQPKHYNKWNYNVRNDEIIFYLMKN